MSCLFPQVVYIKKYDLKINAPCGHCQNCRISKQNKLTFECTWATQWSYAHNSGCSFVTMTYDDDHLIDYDGNPTYDLSKASVSREEIKNYNKRLRSLLKYKGIDSKYMYLACGEYGDSFGRPHYHIILFGIPSELADKLCTKAWKKGQIKVLPLLNGGVRYVTKYCQKQIGGQKALDMYDNKGLHQPFIVHSIRLARQYFDDPVRVEFLTTHNLCYKHDGKLLPLPHYYRQKYAKLLNTYVPPLKEMTQYAATQGRSLADQQYYDSYNKEYRMITELRASGMPVDSKDFDGLRPPCDNSNILNNLAMEASNE